MYDIVVSRATAYIDDILRWSLPFLAPRGAIILYKMPSTDEYRDMKQLLKKYHLTLIGQPIYTLADRDRVLYIITRR
jgi:16S rRNA G527 N7-methylase RsmG